MYKIYASDEKAAYEIGELAKMFVPADSFIIELDENKCSKNEQKRRAYKTLSEGTGKTLDWGILTGVRPGKLFSQIAREGGAEAAALLLRNEYLLSYDKIKLLEEIFLLQETLSYDERRGACGVYIGIPFCPSRCLYCSFTSNVINDKAAENYMRALEKEIAAAARIMKREGLFAESVYIGGGTPTALADREFETLLGLTKQYFISGDTKEWTVECGRPDTITKSKLDCIKKYGVSRISINPQTMKPETLKTIGRSHSPEEIREAYTLAEEYNLIINMDLICGLPGESPKDFEETLREIIAMNPSNITVHTLAVKRASRLIEEDRNYAYKQADTVRHMLEIKTGLLKDAGYEPYYLYRQKQTAGNFENVGYCKDKKASLYNIRIMEENQSIIALGAGGISKIYYPEENRIERIANVSNYEIYIDRIDELIQRKEHGISL